MENQEPNVTTTASLDTQLKNLIEQVKSLNTANKAANNVLYAVLAKCLGIYKSEFLNEGDEQKLARKSAELKKKLEVLTIRYVEKSPVINLLVRFINGTDTKTSSAYSYVIEVAANLNLTEQESQDWFSEVGIENIRRSFNRDGSKKTEGNFPPKKRKHLRDNKVYVDYARRRLLNYSCSLKFDEQDLKQETPLVSTEYAAVLIRHPNGTMELKAMASDASTVAQVFASVAQSKGWEQLADNEQETSQLKALLEKDKLKLVDIRKINENLAKECQQDWENIHSMDNDLAEVPDDFKVYRTYLKKGDGCHNLRSDSGSKYYALALEELTELLKPPASNLEMYLDRPFDPDINPDAELMPRFNKRISKYSNASDGSAKSEKNDVFRDAVQNRIKELSEKQKPRLTADKVVKLMQKRHDATSGKIIEMHN